MKKIIALATAALALAGVLAVAGCAPRAARSDQGTTQQGGPNGTGQNQPPPPAVQLDPVKVDGDLSEIDALLNDVDSDLSAAAKTPEDAD